ncbi:hypothetical protein DFP73DRAFT_527340 [Morchella snyderi]|nr:hypothetical protein DFP73DRAFT_527340 [Morchella snyderi]
MSSLVTPPPQLPLPPHKSGKQPIWQAVVHWFKAKYGKAVSQMTVYSTLRRLEDLLSQVPADSERKKRRTVAWPNLDEVLFEWYKRLEEKSKDFFVRLYLITAFPVGWLDTWKKRHGVKQFVQHGESRGAIACDCVPGPDQMNNIRSTLREYDLEDIYNFDEAGYLYRM